MRKWTTRAELASRTHRDIFGLFSSLFCQDAEPYSLGNNNGTEHAANLDGLHRLR